MGAKPSPGTRKDMRLKANKTTKKKPAKKGLPFGGKKAAPFKKKGS